MPIRDYAIRFLELVGPIGFCFAASFGFLVGAIVGIRGGAGVALLLTGSAFFLACGVIIVLKKVAAFLFGRTIPVVDVIRAPLAASDPPSGRT